MDYQFLYIFTIGRRPEWSGETADSLRERLVSDPLRLGERDKAEDFIARARPGDHTVLTGELKDGTIHQVIIIRARDH
ncbi:MAG: hypothetical protein ABEL51_15740 [Salinibacter sp.]